ncbi:2610_t:CDS:2 [Funneliformis mosseae]|uniref:2610_t:CDS:1 n=1 Tax=Funneliformis mosseae TaxID=27381 RepID=A0A9N9BX09_FUNMO|nr:2610_t:CDS:2 [Funneliformis mosseae]
MSNVYEAIKLLDSKEERTALRALFTKDLEIEARARRVLPICEDNGEIVAYFKELLKPGIEGLKTDEKIWIRYNDERVFIKQSVLEGMAVYNVKDLKRTIIARFKLSENVTIRSESDNLEDSKPVIELFNTEDNAYEIIVEENGNIEVKCIENAFHINYQGSALDTFYRQLILFHDEWHFVKNLFDKDSLISVVYCIDEAHELLERTSITNDETYFHKWKNQQFPSPEIKDTYSARMHEYFLFPAYLDVHTIDVLSRIAPPGNFYDPQRALYLGIPLWGSLAQAGVDLTNVLHLASQKIRNFNKKQEKDNLANLAYMSCSFTLEVCPQMAKVEMLIVSHMATTIGVSDDHTDLLCTYPSDPILTSGALKGIIEVGFEDCLDTLLEQFSRGVVEAGEKGELVSRILFLEAYIRTVKINQTPPFTYLEKVPLLLFLKVLCKGIDEKIDDLFEKMHIDKVEIGFNHWTSLLASNKQYMKEGEQKYLSENLI